LYPPIQLQLPPWVATEIGDPEQRYVDIEARMALVIRLAARNVQESGGPFGAAVFEIETGRLVAPGINLVVHLHSSLAHAEAIAIMMAQTLLGTHDLGAPGLPPMELVTSAQPCIQCYGNLWWSGLRRLIVGATKEDVESLTGFVEGPVPQNWAEVLSHRPPLQPITVIRDVLRTEAQQTLRSYREHGGTIYNPR
jgi:tRNA(Arg) A34 adenosine deaminase TadA